MCAIFRGVTSWWSGEGEADPRRPVDRRGGAADWGQKPWHAAVPLVGSTPPPAPLLLSLLLTRSPPLASFLAQQHSQESGLVNEQLPPPPPRARPPASNGLLLPPACLLVASSPTGRTAPRPSDPYRRRLSRRPERPRRLDPFAVVDHVVDRTGGRSAPPAVARRHARHGCRPAESDSVERATVPCICTWTWTCTAPHVDEPARQRRRESMPSVPTLGRRPACFPSLPRSSPPLPRRAPSILRAPCLLKRCTHTLPCPCTRAPACTPALRAATLEARIMRARVLALFAPQGA